MSRWWMPCTVALALVVACGGGEEPGPGDAAPVDDTVAMTPGGGGSDATTEEPVEAETTMGGEATTASSAEATGAPSPPGGYAVESDPAEDGRLARIEYASPRTVSEVATFYDGRIQTPRKVTVDLAGDDLVAYALSSATTLQAGSTVQDVERLLDQRSEPIVVVSPWKLNRDDPLIRDLQDAGLDGQADQLLNTKSKVTVIYAVR